jgi:hypothetical protein
MLSWQPLPKLLWIFPCTFIPTSGNRHFVNFKNAANIYPIGLKNCKDLLLHLDGLVESTKSRRPFELIYFEGCIHQQDATRREKYLERLFNQYVIFPRFPLSQEHWVTSLVF